jgi:hypothetical protein
MKALKSGYDDVPIPVEIVVVFDFHVLVCIHAFKTAVLGVITYLDQRRQLP